ncbi:MAG: hypothetical protein KBT60_10925 [Methyloceanibacter sp.]|jgi:hypothetical protein|nr:hypothetical protein [Methyloceanibacter sp.]
MSGKLVLRRYWHWVGLALAAAMALILPSRVSQFELKREALVTEDRIRS